MKTNGFSLIAAVALGCLLAGSSIASAQTSTNNSPRGARRLTVQQRADRLASELNLREDQKSKVAALLQEGVKKRQELRADSSLSSDGRRERARTLMREQNRKLKEILTPEQVEKWQKMRPQGRQPKAH